jgi:hypothetical protein
MISENSAVSSFGDGVTRSRRTGIWLAGGIVLLVSMLVLLSDGLGMQTAKLRGSIPTITKNAFISRASGTDSATFHEEQATSAAAFIDSIGVQTHISYIDTPYANWRQVMDEIVHLGIHHIRDALPTTPTFVSNHRQLAAAGIRCTCGFAMDKDLTAEDIVQDARTASDVEALEAPNECDAGTNCGGGGKTGIERVTTLLPVLASAGHELQLPVIGPSFTTREAYASSGTIAQWITFNNLHVYFGGRNPGTEGWGAGDPQGHRYGSFDWWLDQSNLNAPGIPSQITETGYEAFDNPSRPGTIPVGVESTYILRTLLLAWNHGIRRTFIYELLDEFPGNGYGLLRHDMTEKPAFTALRNLISILNDSSRSTTLGRIKFSAESTDPSLSHTLLEKADGTYDLILWLERSSYNSDSKTASLVASEPVHLQLEPKFGIAQIISFNGDGSTQKNDVATKPSSLTVSVNDRLTVVHIVAH